MSQVQTRSEETGLHFHATIKEALDYANEDTTVWKISFEGPGERIRLVKNQETNHWNLDLMSYYLEEKENAQS